MAIGRATVDFLGFQVDMGQIEPRQRKVEARLNFPRPNPKKTLSSWVSLPSYFQRFLPNTHFHWSEKAEAAFVEIKQKMACSSIGQYLNLIYHF